MADFSGAATDDSFELIEEDDEDGCDDEEGGAADDAPAAYPAPAEENPSADSSIELDW